MVLVLNTISGMITGTCVFDEDTCLVTVGILSVTFYMHEVIDAIIQFSTALGI